METVDDVDALGGSAGHGSRGGPVAVLGPGEGERDEAVDGVLVPSGIYDGGVRGAVFGDGLECRPVFSDGFEGRWWLSVICSFGDWKGVFKQNLTVRMERRIYFCSRKVDCCSGICQREEYQKKDQAASGKVSVLFIWAGSTQL